MSRTRRNGLLALATCVSCVLLAAPAGASFHLMKIREVFPNASGTGGDQIEFTVLQATAPGQNLLTGHRVNFYHADGTPSAGCVFPSNPAAGEDQQFYLAAQPGAETMFSITRDCPFAAGGDPLQAAGGAVCWDNTLIDCMAYGNFNNSTAMLPVGTPAPAPPAGMSLTRTIARGCPTALDDADDTNDSAADFSVASPNPRNSASPLTETSCKSGGDQTGPSQILTAKKLQDVDSAAVFERLDEAGTVTLKGKVKVPNASNAARFQTLRLIARAVKTKKSTKSLAANVKTKIKIKLSKSAKKKVKAAIEGSGPRKITVTAIAKDAFGNSSTKKVRFKLTH